MRLVAAVALMLSCAVLSAQTVNICDRTEAVKVKILEATPTVGDACEAVSSQDLAAITTLNLASTGILSLQADDFARLTRLRELDLRDNSLNTLPAGVFSGLDALQTLRLGSNSLSTLPADVFSGLGELRTLRLNNNGLTTLTANAFSGLDQLQILNLSNNGLTTLPDGIFSGLDGLWWLSLASNGLNTLPGGVFSGATNLQYLYLNGNPGSDFSLTVRPRIEFVRLSDGFTGVVARLVLREGAPRPITAVLEATGAVLSADSLAIPVGRTESDDVVTIIRPLGSSEPFELTLGQLTLGNAQSGSQYFGFNVVAGEAVIDVCDRTDEVRAAILDAIPVDRCEGLSPSELAGVTDLDLANPDDAASSGILSLRADDFGGLTGLQTLDLSNNGLDELPAGVFAGLAGLTGVDLSGNPGTTFTLTVRPSIVFSPSSGLFSVKSALLEGAPRTVTVRFTATGATPDVAPPVLTIPTGGVESGAVTLTPDPGNTAVELTLELFGLGGEDENYPGVAIVTETAPFGFANVCARTAAVRAAILAATSTAGDVCDVVSTPELAAITELVLSSDGIKSLQAGDFAGLRGLRTLNLYRNELTTLPATVFSGLDSLQTLRLDGNSLTMLPEGVFAGLNSLVRLDLDDNGLKTLPADVFSGLDSLQALYLYENELTTLPATAFSGLGSLQTLQLHNNSLTALPEGVFAGSTSLQTLYLQRNELTTLPAGVFSGLGSLEDLRLHENSFKALPEGIFAGLRSLRRLDLEDNELETLPAGVFSESTDVRTLFLRNNPWKTLPEGVFAGLTNLTWVWLAIDPDLFVLAPKLEIEPFPLGGNKSTVKLTLREGAPRPITVDVSAVGATLSFETLTIPTGSTESAAVTATLIPGSTSVSLTVTDVRLGGNFLGYLLFDIEIVPVRETVAGICDRTPQVQSGILAETAAPDDVCYNVSPDDLAEILELDLSGAGIESLRAGDFAGLTRLTSLDLTDNQLDELPAGVFSGLTRLTSLDLTGNQFDELPAGVFSGLTGLTEVRLGSNPGTTFTLTVRAELRTSPLPGGSDLLSVKLTLREGAPRLIKAALSMAEGITLSTNFLTIPAGGVESNLIEATRPPGKISAALTLEILTLGGSDDQYPGIRIVGGGQIAGVTTDVCARTAQVRDEILLETPAEDACGAVFVFELAAITALTLSDGQITDLQEDDFAGLRGLRRLDLDNNDLTTLPAGVFSGLDKLQRLYLHGNNLITLSAGVFSGLAGLETLHLYDNDLDALSAGVFAGLDNLRSLWLHDNRLSALPAGVFAGLGNLRSLWLHANPAGLFRFTVRPEFTPSPLPDDFTSAEVKLAVREGAPRPIEVTLSPTEGATLSTRFVTIPPGAVESDPVTITRSPDAVPFELSLMIGEIDYEEDLRTRGIRIVTGAPVEELTLDVCARTDEVRDAILAATPATDDVCEEVLVLELAAIPELNLAGMGITSLQAGDFAGLTGLQTLDLSDNELDELPAGVFAGLAGLTGVDLSGNPGTTFTLTVRPSIEALPVEGFFSMKLALLEGAPREVTVHFLATSATSNATPTVLTIPTGGVESGVVTLALDSGNTSFQVDFGRVVLGGEDEDYPGVEIVAETPPSSFVSVNICDRTAAVRDVILTATSTSGDACETVSIAELAAITGLDLSEAGIESLQAGDFAGLRGLLGLGLGDNDLTTLPATIFSGLDNLQTLHLYGNDLTTLPATVFSGLTDLRELSLRDNDLEALPADVFSGLDSLRILYLFGNRLTTVPAGIFSGLDNLRTLRLDRNRLTTLPEGLFAGLGNLVELELDRNQLTTLPAGIFSGLDSLEELELHENRLAALPEGIFAGLTSLEALDLERNNLETLPADAFSGSINLWQLYLRNNPWKTLPEGLFSGLTNLSWVWLNIDSNLFVFEPKLEIEPFPLGGNKSRVRLTLREGAPRHIVVDISPVGVTLSADSLTISPGMTESAAVEMTLIPGSTSVSLTITSITLGGSVVGYAGFNVEIVPVREAAAGICGRTLQVQSAILAETTAPDDACYNVSPGDLTEILELDLSGAGIESLRAGDFAWLVNLRDLDLSSNAMTFLPDRVFSDLSGMRTLDLRDNLLSSLSSDALNLPELRVLDLSANPLISSPGMSLGMNIFTHLSSLEELYLSGISSFTTGLPAGIFSGLSRLRGLHLPVDDEGAPLTSLGFEFVRTDDEEAGSLSAEVELRVPEGAPFPVQADLDFERLTGPSQVTMATGSTRTGAFVVTLTSQVLDGVATATPPEAPMTMDCQRPSASAPHACYQGVGFPPAARFTLGKATDLPEVTIADESSMVSVKEGDTAAVTVRAHRPLSEALTVAYTTGAARAGRADADRNDYTDVGAGMVTIAAGETTAAILIRIDDDSDVEPTREVFRVSLSEDASYVLGRSEQIAAIVVIDEGVCDRARAVEEAIVTAAAGADDCAGVDDAILAGVDSLTMTGAFNLQASDFSGLDALRELHLEGANLGPLPAGIFSGVRDTLRVLNMRDVTLEESLPAGIFVGLSLDVLRLPPGAALSLQFNVVEENAPSNPTSARISVILAQGAPFALSVGLSAVNAALSTDSLVIPAGGVQSAVFEVRRGSGEEVPVVRFADDPGTVKEGVVADLSFDVSDRYVMGTFRPTDVTITSTAAAGNVYAAGETITAEVTFGDDVHVSTAPDGPRLALDIGDQIRFAGLAGTRTDALIFEYEVTQDDYDTDGISIGVSALALGSAGITDSFGNPVRLELGAHAVGNAAAHKVAGRRLSLSFDPPSAALMAGETVQVRVVLGNAGALSGNLPVVISPGAGLSVDQEMITFTGGGDTSINLNVSASLTATLGESNLAARVEQNVQDSLRTLVPAALAGVQINQRVIRVSFEPNPVVLVRGGAGRDVVVSASPPLAAGEEFTVVLSAPQGVTVLGDRAFGAGSDSRRTLTLSADASAASGFLTATTVEGTVTLLGAPEVRFDELRVEAVPLVSVEFTPETVEIVQGRSTMITMTTNPALEAGQSVTVELTVPDGSGLRLGSGEKTDLEVLELALSGPDSTMSEVAVSALVSAGAGDFTVAATLTGVSGVATAEMQPPLPVKVLLPQVSVEFEPADELVLAAGSEGTVVLTLGEGHGLQAGQEAVLDVLTFGLGMEVSPMRVTLAGAEPSTEVKVSANSAGPFGRGFTSRLVVRAASGVRLEEARLPVRVDRAFRLSFMPTSVELFAGGAPAMVELRLDPLADSRWGRKVEVMLTPSQGLRVESEEGEVLNGVALKQSETSRILVIAEPDAPTFATLKASASDDNVQIREAELQATVLLQPGQRVVALDPSPVEVVQGREAVFTVTTTPPLENGQSATVGLEAPAGSGLTLSSGGVSGNSLTLLLVGTASTMHEVMVSASVVAPVGAPELMLTVIDSSGITLSLPAQPLIVNVMSPQATMMLEPEGELVLTREGSATVKLTLRATPELVSGQEAVFDVTLVPEIPGLSVTPGRVTLTADVLSTEVTVSATSDAAGGMSALTVTQISGVELPDEATLPVRVEREFALLFEPERVELTAGGLPMPVTLRLTAVAGSLAPGETVEVVLRPSMGLSVSSESGGTLDVVTLTAGDGAATRIRVSADLDADYRSSGALTASASLDNAQVDEANLPVSVRQRKIAMFFEPPEIRQVRGGAAPAMTLPTRVRLKVAPALQSAERLVVNFTPASSWAFLLYEYTFTSMTESVEVFVIADMNTSSGEIRPSVSVEEGDLTVELTPLTVEVVRGVRLSLSAHDGLDVATIIAGKSADVTLATGAEMLEGDEQVTVTLTVGDNLTIDGASLELIDNNKLILTEANQSATVRVSAPIPGLDLAAGVSASGMGGNVEVLGGASLRVLTRDADGVSVVLSPSAVEIQPGGDATLNVTTVPPLGSGQSVSLTLTIFPEDAGLSFADGSFSTTVELVGGADQAGAVNVAVTAAPDAAFGGTVQVTSSFSGEIGVDVVLGTRSQVRLTVAPPRVSVRFIPAQVEVVQGSSAVFTVATEPALEAGQSATVELTVSDGSGLLLSSGGQAGLKVLELSLSGPGSTMSEVTISAPVSARAGGFAVSAALTGVSGVSAAAVQPSLPVEVLPALEREFALSFEPTTVKLTAGGLPRPATLRLTAVAGSLAPGETVEVVLRPSMGLSVSSESGETLGMVTLTGGDGAATRIRVSADLDADYRSSGVLTASALLDNARVNEANLQVQVLQRKIAMFFDPPEIRQVRGGAALAITFTRVRLKVAPVLQRTERLVVDFGPVSGWRFSPQELTFTRMTESVDVSIFTNMDTSSGEIRPSVRVEEGDLMVELTPLTVEVVRGVSLSLSAHDGPDVATIIARKSTDVTLATEPALEGDERVTVTLTVGDNLTIDGASLELIDNNKLVLTEANQSATVRVSASVSGLDLTAGVSASGVGGNVEVLDDASLGVVTRHEAEVSVVVSPPSLEVEQGGRAAFQVTTEPRLVAGQAATLTLTILQDDAGLSFVGGSFSTMVELVGGADQADAVNLAVTAAPDAALGNTAQISWSRFRQEGVEVNVDPLRSRGELTVVAPRVGVRLRLRVFLEGALE